MSRSPRSHFSFEHGLAFLSFMLLFFLQFGAKLARVQSTAQWSQQQQQHGSNLLPQSVFKRVSLPHRVLTSLVTLYRYPTRYTTQHLLPLDFTLCSAHHTHVCPKLLAARCAVRHQIIEGNSAFHKSQRIMKTIHVVLKHLGLVT